MSHHHFHHHHHHTGHSVRGDYTYSEEPVTELQKRVWRTKGIIWMIPTGLIVFASLVLAIVFSVIDSKLPGSPFFVMPVFAGVPLAFGLPYMEQGFTKKPQVTQIYDYGSYKRTKVVKVKVKCPKCETENQYGSTNCKECGEALPQCCPHCGADIIPNDEACRDCGLALK